MSDPAITYARQEVAFYDLELAAGNIDLAGYRQAVDGILRRLAPPIEVERTMNTRTPLPPVKL